MTKVRTPSARLGEPLLDLRAAEALDLVRSKQDADGRWKLDNAQNGTILFGMETKGQPSHRVTLRALQVLRATGR